MNELLVVLAVLFVLAAIVLPMLAKSHAKSNRVGCSAHLKQIGLAFRNFSGDNGDKLPMQLSVTNGGFLELLPHVSPAAIFLTMTNELGSARIVYCPDDLERQPAEDFGPGFTNRNVSFFVGLDAPESVQWESAQWVLAGDRNLTANRKPVGTGLAMLSTNQTLGWTSKLHAGEGNLGFGDGSVQRVTARQLQEAFAQTGLATNRLAIP